MASNFCSANEASRVLQRFALLSISLLGGAKKGTDWQREKEKN